MEILHTKKNYTSRIHYEIHSCTAGYRPAASIIEDLLFTLFYDAIIIRLAPIRTQIVVHVFFDVAIDDLFAGWVIIDESIFARQRNAFHGLGTGTTVWFPGITHFSSQFILK
jgi:hypothetical protein